MTVGSLQFLVPLLLLTAVFPWVPSVRARQVVLAACNVGFFATFHPNLATWLALAAFVGSGYAVGAALRRRPSTALLGGYLVLLVAAFVVLKKYVFLGALLPPSVLGHAIAVVGLSYMLFRQIHYLVDCREGQVDGGGLWDYANYQLGFLTLLAGPIQRFQEFREYWGRLEPVPRDRHEVLTTWLRILWGVVKLAGLASLFLLAYDKFHGRLLDKLAATHPHALPVLVLFAGSMYLYPLYMYANFSGYCDVVIGAAALLGNRLPENFDNPQLSRNILDFWTRWHRTLGFWIRDYLFMPSYRWVAERLPRQAPSLAFACYFLAFVIAGVWHGTTANFLAFGILHGAGASAAKLYEMFLVKRKGRAWIRQYMKSQRRRAVAIFLCLNYVCFTMLFFADSLGGTLKLLRGVGACVAGLAGR